MSLKKDIEDIFKKNTGYAEPEHAINQAESLKSLSVDLYTDSKRFVYELLQNADDSVMSEEPVKVGIRLFDDFLVVAHTGKPFDTRDLRGICGVSDGTKKNSVEKTGYKGIGFKAVFGQSEKVIIYTNGEFFRFDSKYAFEWNNKWGEDQLSWEKENERQFSYPWQIIPIYTNHTEIDGGINAFLAQGEWAVATIVLLSKGKNDVKNALDELSSNVNMFLFLKNIKELDFDLGTLNIITLHRELGGKAVEIKQNGQIKASWILRTVKLEVPNEVKLKLKEEKNIPDKLLNANETELTFAAKIGEYGIKKLEINERLLYSYLPTEETKYAIPVLVNSSFVISANRETLHEDSKWNQWLFQNIPCELLKWVAELVIGKYGDQAYELIPKTITSNSLGSYYNNGLLTAYETIPFILSNHHELIKINQAIVDFTSISKKKFITEGVIKDFVIKEYNKETIHVNPFLPFTNYAKTLRNIGIACFEWEDVSKLLKSDIFLSSHSASKNIQIIQYFKELCESEKQKISETVINNWSFVLDHKGNLHCPNNIYFPTPDDKNWNDLNSEISFLHIDIQKFLLHNPETRSWLEKLGVIEKTDLSYLRKTIIENASTYSTHENSIETILNIFSLYVKREIGKDELGELSELKILTEKGSLLPAKSCYFSDSYSPRIKLQTELSDDIFVSEKYMVNKSNRDEWRRFFKMMGVNEGIAPISYNGINKNNLIQNYHFKNDFFELEDKFFKPWQTRFHADEYSNLITFNFLSESSNFSFSKIFWTDIIENIKIEDFNAPTIAYWGNSGRAGRITGNGRVNYLKWYIQNVDCIPTLMEITQKANDIYINSEDILEIAGNYLPVFGGVKLPQDWKAFFNFKTKLELADYLEILRKIASDVNSEGKIKKDNINRIQSIYRILLDQCTNWSEEDISKVEEWATTGYLLNTKKEFTECSNLKYFLDGNESIFQDYFCFLILNAENKRHSSLEFLLKCFKLKVLKQSDFELIHSQEENCSDLVNKLKLIIPYFKIWVENESIDDNTRESLGILEHKIETLKIFQTEYLKIKYADVGFIKSINVHFNKPNLFVTKPWTTNSVLLKLPEVLSRYFCLLGHDKKLDFLLRSTLDEMLTYFEQEGINIPEEIHTSLGGKDIQSGIASEQEQSQKFNSFAEIESAINEGRISPEFFHWSKSDYERLKFAEKLVSRAVSNVITYLTTLQEYDCTNHYKIADSIIGGITKNGNEITVVARPSDDDKVLLYYTSEFDVLEYVDAEFWCEDGINIPKQITLGHLLKKTGINRIPIANIGISNLELNVLAQSKKSETLDFNAVPFVPEKIAKIVSSFANTNGGSLIFGLKETSPSSNEVVGLSSDFRVVEIIKKAISLLVPIPTISYDWVKNGDSSIFVIQTMKSKNDILFDNQKYIRVESNTLAEKIESEQKTILSRPSYTKTIAIIIGIEDYLPKNQISRVKYAKADTLKFKMMLIDDLGVDENEIYMFINDEALKSSIEYDLKSLFHSLTADDRLIFYYAGHGFHNGITNYLSTYDMHKSNIPETAVSLRKILLDPLRNSKCKIALIFIDACAQSFKEENGRNEISNINDEELIILTNEFPYYGTFLSCQPGQSSYSSDILKNGIWTHHLAKAISGNVPEVIHSNRYITDRLLMDYLSSSVAEYTKKELAYDQNPRAVIDSSNENIILEIPEKVIE